MLIEIILFLLLIFMAIYWYVTKDFGFFKRMGIPEDPGYFPFGSSQAWKVWTGKASALDFALDPNGGKFEGEKFFGMYSFGQRNLIVRDIDLAKRIAIKDAEYFIDRMTFGIPYHEATDEVDKVFGLMLTNVGGDVWKKLRTKASPVFTSGKLKLMVPHINKCALNMREIMSEAADNGNIIDAKDMYGKFALDAIATSGFGIESNSFKDPDNAFREHARRLIRDPKYASVWDMPKFILAFVAPKVGKALGIRALNAQSTMFFVNIIRQAMANRRKTGARRNDVIDIFLDEMDKEKSSDDILSKEEDEISFISTAILFFFAGFDTTSTTLSLVVHALMYHPEVQEKVRKEIEDVIGDSDDINADQLNDLKYTENVIHESMRKYFSFALQRVCTRDYKIPDTDIVIPKGLMINLLPKQDECFANYKNFDPDNFEESDKLNKYGFIGFGQGPRNCIGMRYALRALKLAIIHTVRTFQIVAAPGTPEVDKLFFSIQKNGFTPSIKFRVEKIK